MEEKLQKLYRECVEELKTVNIDVTDKDKIGEIDIKLAKRKAKRYGCCKQEEPVKEYYRIQKNGRTVRRVCERFQKHHIEVSKWVMDLDENIIKNTIMHEIIHCFPNCNNHGEIFKMYASQINEKLGYNITRVGNKKEDYEKSNLEYTEKVPEPKYKIQCQKCGQIIYRSRLKKDLEKRYRCGKCNGKLKLL